jgi:hypothetical protein
MAKRMSVSLAPALTLTLTQTKEVSDGAVAFDNLSHSL